MKKILMRAAVTLCLAALPLWVPSGRAGESASKAGQNLYHIRCDFCHLEHCLGTFVLERRLGKGKGLLEKRADLTPDYIRLACRSGIGSMISLNRVELPDKELDLIVAYLTRSQAGRGAQSPSGEGKRE